jgi:hypothetical protein
MAEGGDYGIYVPYGSIKITDSEVTATGDFGGIWNAYGDLTIDGGTVTATSDAGYGLYSSFDGNIIISGGVVTATGYYSGIASNDGDLVISGGAVTAIGIVDYGLEIFVGDLRITDGIDVVTAIGGTSALNDDPAELPAEYMYRTNTDKDNNPPAAWVYSSDADYVWNAGDKYVRIVVASSQIVLAVGDQTNVTENGGSDGSATVAVTGGVGPYTYEWSHDPNNDTDTATGLPAGEYTVTVTDDLGDKKTLKFTITEPEAQTLGDELLNKTTFLWYLAGYPNGDIAPDRPITRAEVATIFYRLLKVQALDGSEIHKFPDVAEGKWYTPQIKKLTQLGILKGYPDGTFRPDDYITRAELITIIARLESLSSTAAMPFPDIKSSHWAIKSMAGVYDEGWINGYPDGTFRPDQSITRAETAKVVNCEIQRTVKALPAASPFPDLLAKHWAYGEIVIASPKGEPYALCGLAGIG